MSITNHDSSPILLPTPKAKGNVSWGRYSWFMAHSKTSRDLFSPTASIFKDLEQMSSTLWVSQRVPY